MKIKEAVFVGVLSCCFSLPFSLLQPVLPRELTQHALGEFLQGSLFSLYSIPWFIAPFFLANCLAPRIGLISSTQVATFMLFLSVLAYTVAYALQPGLSFYVLTVLARLLQGIGSSASLTGYIALISKINREDKTRTKAAATRSCGSQVGFGLGLTVADILHATVGELGVFALVGVMMLGIIAALELYRFRQPLEHTSMPYSITKTFRVELYHSSEHLLNFISVRVRLELFQRVAIGILNSLLINSLFLMFQPSLPSKLSSSFNFSQSMIEVYINVYVMSIIGGSALTLFLLINLAKESIITFGSLISALGLFLIGPSKLFNLPDIPETILAGIVTCGFGRSVAVSLLLAEIIQEGNSAFPELKDQIPGTASAFYVTALGVGSVLTPFLSRSLASKVGFGVSMDVFGIIVLLFTLTRFVIWKVDSQGESRLSNIVRASRAIQDEEQESLVTVVEMRANPAANSI